MTTVRPTTTLWRPTGPEELALVAGLEWRAWPPRLPEQPIFYPVLNEEYAIAIARDWNVKHSGSGFVTRFEVDSEFLRRYPVQQAGGRTILELWVPAEELDEFNTHIVGRIEVVHEFHRDPGAARDARIAAVVELARPGWEAARDTDALQAFLKENGCHGAEATRVTMALLGCGLREASEAYFRAPCRQDDAAFHNGVIDALEEAADEVSPSPGSRP